MPQGGPNERDAKLIQWLNEAYAKEAELEADLTAHIALTQKDSYKKRLRKHLSETKAHKKDVGKRIRALGGKATTSPDGIPGVPGAVGEAAGKAVAAVKGQVGTVRAAVTSQAETHLRNAQEELREEHVEIAIYRRIEAFANEVSDRETAQLAKRIIREEERMAKFLDSEIVRLVKEIVRADVPRDQRGGTTRRRTSSRSSSGSSSSRSSSSRSSSSRSASSRSSSSGSSGRSRGGSSSSGSSSSRSRGSTGGSRSSGSSSGSGSRSSGSGSSAGSGGRSSGSRSSGSGSRSSGSRSRSSSNGSSSGSRSTAGSGSSSS